MHSQSPRRRKPAAHRGLEGVHETSSSACRCGDGCGVHPEREVSPDVAQADAAVTSDSGAWAVRSQHTRRRSGARADAARAGGGASPRGRVLAAWGPPLENSLFSQVHCSQARRSQKNHFPRRFRSELSSFRQCKALISLLCRPLLILVSVASGKRGNAWPYRAVETRSFGCGIRHYDVSRRCRFT